MTVAIWCHACMPTAGFSRPSTPTTGPGSGRGCRWRWPPACASSRRPEKAAIGGSAGTSGSGASAFALEETGQKTAQVGETARVEQAGQVETAAQIAETAQVATERSQIALKVPQPEGEVVIGDRCQICVETRRTHRRQRVAVNERRSTSDVGENRRLRVGGADAH